MAEEGENKENEVLAVVGEVEEAGGDLGEGKCEARGPGEVPGWTTGGPLSTTGEMTGGRPSFGTTEGAEVVVEEVGEGEEEEEELVEATETETRRERRTSSEK